MARSGATAGLASLLAALAACGLSTPAEPAGPAPVQVSVAGMRFALASGAARSAGGVLVLYLSDQVDTCLAVQQVPVGTMHLLALQVAPAADGTTAAAVVAPVRPAPAAGEAQGRLTESTGGAVARTLETAGGSVAWTPAADGSVAVHALDLGFAGTADRLTAGAALRLAACP
ncbi:MAG: hypothetical protein HZB56_05780 [Deltaproteobacteria bacterium]|nr:hypothetical protein [Deltaproteobacteria bacterium]